MTGSEIHGSRNTIVAPVFHDKILNQFPGLGPFNVKCNDNIEKLIASMTT